MKHILATLLIVLVFGCKGDMVGDKIYASLNPMYRQLSDSTFQLLWVNPIDDTIRIIEIDSGVHLDNNHVDTIYIDDQTISPPKPSPIPDTIKKFYDTSGMPIMIIDGMQTCYLYCLGENQKLALYYYCMATVLHPKPNPIPDTTKPLKIKMQPRWRTEDSAWSGSPITPIDSILLGGTGMVSTTILGTKYDSLISKWTDASKATRGETFTITPVQDTSRCLLLVSDTSNQNGFRSSRCWWMEGYVVNKEKYGGLTSMVCMDKDGNVIYCPNSEYYLDQSKIKLKKNFIVWLSKEVK